MASIKGDDGSTATVTLAPGLTRQRTWENGRQIRKWGQGMLIARDNKGFYHRIEGEEAQELQRSGKCRILDPYEPVLIQNDHNSYTFVRAERAEDMCREKKAVIMQPNDPDFVRGTKLAMGVDPDGQFAKGQMIQRFGKPVGIEDIGYFDVDQTIKAAEELAATLKADEKTGLVTENLPAADSFLGKERSSFKGTRGK